MAPLSRMKAIPTKAPTGQAGAEAMLLAARTPRRRGTVKAATPVPAQGLPGYALAFLLVKMTMPSCCWCVKTWPVLHCACKTPSRICLSSLSQHYLFVDCTLTAVPLLIHSLVCVRVCLPACRVADHLEEIGSASGPTVPVSLQVLGTSARRRATERDCRAAQSVRAYWYVVAAEPVEPRAAVSGVKLFRY